MVGSTREFSIDSRPPAISRYRATIGRVLRRLRANRLAFLGLIGIVAIVLMAIFAPILAPYPPDKMETRIRFLPPGSPGHVLGTDEFGRDVLSRIIYGSRVSLLVSI